MIREQSLVSGHPAVCHIVVGDICVYVGGMKELFRTILREPPGPDLLLWEVRLMSAYSHLAFSWGQELKGRFPLVNRCWLFCGYKLPDKDGNWPQRKWCWSKCNILKLRSRFISCNFCINNTTLKLHSETVNIPNASYLRIQNILLRLKVHKEETNCTGNEYLMTTPFFTLWR